MALFAIGDLHLSFGVDKKMDVFGGKWENYEKKIHENWISTIKAEDTVILCGDTSWGMTLDEAMVDFEYIESLPGKKILIKGNHDYWWTTVSKMNKFLDDCGIYSISFLHNEGEIIDGIPISGSRGWFMGEGDANTDDKKIIHREADRLALSIEKARTKAKKENITKSVSVFMHYQPAYGNLVCDEIFDVLKKYEIKDCYYGHIHYTGIRRAVTGEFEGVNLHLISADNVDFLPQMIL